MDRLFWHRGIHLPFWQSIACFVLGCILSLFLLNTPVFFLTITLVVLVGVLTISNLKTKIVVISAFLFGLTYPIIYYHCVYNTHLSYAELQQKQLIKGKVERIDDYLYTYRLSVKPSVLGTEKIAKYKKLTLQLYLTKQSYDKNTVRIGDTITTLAKLKPIVPVVNEGIFDRRLYNFYHGIKYKGSISNNSLFKVNRKDFKQRARFLNVSEYSWLYSAVLFGDTSKMPRDFKDISRQLGISHLFAVSGLHMTIVFAFSYWIVRVCCLFFNKYNRLKVLPLLVGILSCALYLHFSNYATSAQRAFVMLCAFCLCWQVNRAYIGYRALMFALLCVFIFNPFVSLTVGFYFSFAAVLSILLSLDLIKKFKIQSYLAKFFVLQVAISTTLISVTVFFFNGFSIYSLFVNLIAIPFFSFVLMPAILLASLLSSILQTDLFITFLDPLLALIVTSINELNDIGSWLNLPSITWQLTVLMLISSLLLLYTSYSLYLTLPLMVFYLSQASVNQDQLVIRVIDVGHGLAVLLSHNNQAVLYDVGAKYSDFSYVKSVILPTIRINNLQLMRTVISHDDNDHSGGLSHLIENGKLATISGFGKACNFNANWLSNITFESISINTAFKSDNNNSCVVLVTYKHFKLLLTGDIEKKREQALLNDKRITDIDVLISPHHGSNSSSTNAFIKHTNPSWVFHSVNAYNRWKFPSLKVVERYASNNTKQLATYHGAIKLTVTDKNYTVSSQKRLKNYWFLVD